MNIWIGVLVVVCMLAVIAGFFAFLRTRGFPVTLRPRRPGEIRSLYETPGTFDLFVSYRRAYYAEEVRRVAEALLARNFRTWIDDYALAQVNTLDKKALTKAISAGIDRSDNAVIFRTHGYGRSEFCEFEDNSLKEHFPSSRGKLITLAKVPSSESAGANRIVRQLGLVGSESRSSIHPSPTIQPEPDWYCDDQAGYRFDATGWQRIDAASKIPIPGSYKGPVFFLRDDPHHRRTLTIDTGPAFSNSSAATRGFLKGDRFPIIRRALWGLFEGPPPSEDRSEKELWDEGYRFARRYTARRRVALCGSHLLILGGGYHFALTYWHHDHWVRRYSIIATDRLTDVMIEVAVTISFHGTFTEFCAAAREMDTLVHSLSWLPTEDALSVGVDWELTGSQLHDAAALTNAAYFDVGKGRVDAAETKLQLALSLADLADTHNEYATVCLLCADYEKAVHYIFRAIQLAHNNPKFWSCLSRAYGEWSQHTSANSSQKYLRAGWRCMLVAHSIDPNYPTYRKAVHSFKRVIGDSDIRRSHELAAKKIVALLGTPGSAKVIEVKKLEAILRR